MYDGTFRMLITTDCPLLLSVRLPHICCCLRPSVRPTDPSHILSIIRTVVWFPRTSCPLSPKQCPWPCLPIPTRFRWLFRSIHLLCLLLCLLAHRPCLSLRLWLCCCRHQRRSWRTGLLVLYPISALYYWCTHSWSDREDEGRMWSS